MKHFDRKVLILIRWLCIMLEARIDYFRQQYLRRIYPKKQLTLLWFQQLQLMPGTLSQSQECSHSLLSGLLLYELASLLLLLYLPLLELG